MEALPQGERKLTVSTALTDGQVAICVADRGPGIAEDDLHKVFDPFWSTKDSGMGMGLAICRSIAEAHRGCLSSRNAAEGGAVFCVQLPARPSP
jgi:two-component system sensor histidine kinase DctS